jgi:hypothetical protein
LARLGAARADVHAATLAANPAAPEVTALAPIDTISSWPDVFRPSTRFKCPRFRAVAGIGRNARRVARLRRALGVGMAYWSRSLRPGSLLRL